MKSRYMLGHYRQTQNFVQYPTCKDVNLLAQFGLVDIIFPDVDTASSLQVSIIDCNTNTLVYNSNNTPLLANAVVANQPYSIIFTPSVGGYVITSPTTPATLATSSSSSSSSSSGDA